MLLLKAKLVPFLLPALIVTCVQAQVMECTDSLGRKEYSTTCPSGTVSQRELRSRTNNQAGVVSDAPQSSYQDQEKAFQQRRIQRETAEDAEAQRLRQQKIAERDCASERRKMEQLQSGRRLRWVDKATRERTVMTEAEHEAEMVRVENELRRCRS